MVLHDGGDHYVVGTQAKAVGEMVESFGRIAADDRDVVAALASREQEGRSACVLVRVGRKLRLVAGAAVDSSSTTGGTPRRGGSTGSSTPVDAAASSAT